MTEPDQEWMQALWAKTGADGATHLLPYHLIDVAEAAHTLWENAIGAGTQALVSRALGLTEEQASHFLAFAVGLHDLGKASPGFQRKYEPAVPRLRDLGLPFGLGVADIPHGVVSSFALAYREEGLLIRHGLTNRATGAALARAIGGHHGIWPSHVELKNAHDACFQPEWESARETLFLALLDLYQPSAISEDTRTGTEAFNACLVCISGLTAVADWIGSMVEFFPLRDEWIPLEAYQQNAREQAHRALHETGWLRESRTIIAPPFTQILPKPTDQPNSVQRVVLASTAELSGQTLVILEAPTGIGKTELAFHLSSRLLESESIQGMYIAMPTQATSNEMFNRTTRFLHVLFPDLHLRPRLLHSQAQWQFDAKQIPSGIYDGDVRDRDGATFTWFLPKKRGLLEPFAVGTVDQALLSVLWTRHFFVRLFGLRHKALIFDEVHAYDTYMNELFMTLLAWMRRLGSSVIILSATLPNASRRRLVEQFGGATEELSDTDSCNARLTLIDATRQTSAVSLDEVTEGRTISLEQIAPEALVDGLSDALHEGGCVALICNTVRHAQERYRELRQAQDRGDLSECELRLFHARYPAAWRQGIEGAARQSFGKEGPRPHRAILVATQVIEQSLDLDFDLLITELPPIDLLIQRVGRLHRHEREGRPLPLQEPRVLLFEPSMQDDLPSFGDSEFIYDRFLLLASWAVLQDRSTLRLPDESRELIETVYGEGWRDLPWQEALASTHPDLLARRDQDQYQAALKHIPSPDASKLLDGHNLALDEENPAVHRVFQALTRMVEPTVQVICVHQVDGGYALEPDGAEPVDWSGKPDLHRLLRYVVNIGQRWVFQAITENSEFDLPPTWRVEKALKYHRIAVFREGLCRVAGTRYVLRLSREYGLEVLKEDEL